MITIHGLILGASHFSTTNKYFYALNPSPILHGNTDWIHSSHGQRELLHLYVLTSLVSILDITLACYYLDLIFISLLLYFKVVLMLIACHHKKLSLLSFTYSRTIR